jgi:hypothetical protein
MESDRCAIQHDPTNSVIIVSWYERETGSIVSVMNPASTMAKTARIAVTVREYTAGAFNDTVQERPEPQPMSVHIRKMIAMIPPMAKCSASWYSRCTVRASTAAGDAAAATNMAGTWRMMPAVRVIPAVWGREGGVTAEWLVVSAPCAHSASRSTASSDNGCGILSPPRR